MSIAFTDWVMEEQEKDEEKMLIDEDNISTYKDIELIARSLKTSEKLEPYVQNRLDTIIKKCNERINSFEAYELQQFLSNGTKRLNQLTEKLEKITEKIQRGF